MASKAMEEDDAGVVNDSWEDLLVDSGALDKKLEEMKSRLVVDATASSCSQQQLSDGLAPSSGVTSFEGGYGVIVQEDVPRTQYCPPTPQVKILKRPGAANASEHSSGTDGDALMNGVVKAPLKSLQQREAEYAEARLRILGSAKNEEDIVEERLAKITLAAGNSGAEVEEVEMETGGGGVGRRKKVVTSEAGTLVDTVHVLRSPVGPDGTRGFAAAGKR